MTRSEAGKLGGLKVREITIAKSLAMRDEYYKNPNKCTLCQTVISFENKRNEFCSHSCAAVVINSRRHAKNAFPIPPHPCLNCGIEIKISRKRQYCSHTCVQEHRSKIYIENWLAGKEDGITCGGMNTTNYIRNWLHETRGEKCEECGWAEKHPLTGKIPIQLHHVNGIATDNKPENLKLLCPNCHCLTDTFGGRNRGNGRSIRTIRYRELKQSNAGIV